MTKYVFVTGGVVSGLGKGITAASLGRLGLFLAALRGPFLKNFSFILRGILKI